MEKWDRGMTDSPFPIKDGEAQAVISSDFFQWDCCAELYRSREVLLLNIFLYVASKQLKMRMK